MTRGTSRQLPTVPLAEVLLPTSQRDPARFPSETFVYVDIGSADPKAKAITAPQRILGSDAPSRARKVIETDDVLVATVRPNLNSVALVPKELHDQIASTGFSVLRADRQRLNPRFLNYFTRSRWFIENLVRLTVGANYPAVTDAQVKAIPIPLPPLPEQERIVQVLDEAEALRQLRVRADQQTAELLLASYHQRFGHPLSNPHHFRFYRLVEITSPKQWPTISEAALTEAGYPVYGANGRIGFYHSYNHEQPTVLITCRGATCGTINICEPQSYVTGNSMALDDPDENLVTREFLEWALRARGLADTITGAAQPQITRNNLESVVLPLPSLEEQRDFSTAVTQVRALEAVQAASQLGLENLFQSLLHRGFQGEL